MLPSRKIRERLPGRTVTFNPGGMAMTRYLIDIRLMGPVEKQVRMLSDQLRETFGLVRNLVVPHITLAGPFSTDDEPRLLSDFARVCREQVATPHYDVGGYGFFDTTRVVYVTITPDETLRQFRFDLAQAIAPYCNLREYDRDSAGDFRFHATLAMKLPYLAYTRIRWYFRKQEPVVFRHHPIRATVLKNAKVLCEYDFMQGRMLTPSQARSRATRKRDAKVLRIWETEE